MTTREWFRLQRGALWVKDSLLANEVDQIATTIIDGNDPWRGLTYRLVGPALAIVNDVQTYQRRVDALEAVRQDMEQALRRLGAGRGLTE